MNAVVYNTNKHKKINGTLFYCFEYYSFLKQYIPKLQFILLNTTDEDLELFKSIFLDKYNIDIIILNDVINFEKITQFIKLDIENLLILDVKTYTKIKDFSYKIKNIKIYSNDDHIFLNKKHNHIFYGWYDYQKFNIKTKLKIYKEIHKIYAQKGDKIFLTSPLDNIHYIASKLGLKQSTLLVKKFNKHHTNLFKEISTLIYWHDGILDKNNRSIIEAYIHNLNINVHLNGVYNDSVNERYNDILLGKADEYFLDENDLLIKDFINDCKIK